jgi:hypothetical protein
MAASGYLYAIQTREFLNQKESVVKIGRTHDIVQRFKSYPKGSRLLCTIYVEDYIKKEQILIQNLREIYKQRKDLGSEYFEGRITDMLNVLMSLNETKDGIILEAPRNNRIYVCVRCGMTSKDKRDMRIHFYNRKNTCPALVNDIELTDEVKEYILLNRTYKS